MAFLRRHHSLVKKGQFRLQQINISNILLCLEKKSEEPCRVSFFFLKILIRSKGDSAFPWISTQPLSEPLLNMHMTFYNPWNKCPKSGLMTTGGQIPIEKHYRSFVMPYKIILYMYMNILTSIYLLLPNYKKWSKEHRTFRDTSMISLQ